jgi:cell division transport system ATP-binding protein
MLRFEAVGLRYERSGARSDGSAGPEVLHDISFGLEAGAFRWLLGPSGAGKTSLLRLLYLAVRPTRGRLTLFDTDVARAPRRALPKLRRRIGVVFQDFRLLPHLSAFDNVALPLRIAGRPEGQIRADVGELLRWVGLSAHLEARPAELSGGEQQRVAIARAVITRPALLLADEPTGNLDDGQAERLMQLFKEMNRIGTTVIVATHNETLVSRHPAPALHIEAGRLTAGRGQGGGVVRFKGPGGGPDFGPDRGSAIGTPAAGPQAGGTREGGTREGGPLPHAGGPRAGGPQAGGPQPGGAHGGGPQADGARAGGVAARGAPAGGRSLDGRPPDGRPPDGRPGAGPRLEPRFEDDVDPGFEDDA